MKGSKHTIALLVLVLFSVHQASAQYWFQFGARTDVSAAYNNGSSVQLQTITPQTLTSGSLGFWVGEDLANGAFLQIGYLIENSSGSYTSFCTMSQCNGTEYIKAGDAEWFYEYFPANHTDTFLGMLGPDGSAGANGTFNTYGFYSSGDTWYFVINGNIVGSVDLGTSSSGPYSPVAFGELANTSGTGTHIRPIIFANLSIRRSGGSLPVPIGTAYVGYGQTSLRDKPDPYGVAELDSRTDYFEAGSLTVPQQQNGTKLWSLGYSLKVLTPYGGSNSTTTYQAYSSVKLQAPSMYYLSNDTRAVFTGWTGQGAESYTGPSNSIIVTLYDNITETANWKIQYLVSIASQYGVPSGGGWYTKGTTATLGLPLSQVSNLSSVGTVFYSWSNRQTNTTFNTAVNSPMDLSAIFRYAVRVVGKDATGNIIAVNTFIINGNYTNSTPLLFGNTQYSIEAALYKGTTVNASQTFNISMPTSVSVTLPVYPVTIQAHDLFGIPIDVTAQMTFLNGTTENITASNGIINVSDVPDGYAKVGIRYLGLSQTFTASRGVAQLVHVLSIYNIAGLAAAVIIVAYAMLRRWSRIRQQ